MQKTSNKWLIFILVAIAQLMVVLDNAITNVALPTIRTQLHFATDSLQWVVTAYALFFGGFLLLGGRAADLYGRRRMLMSGMAAFTTFSLLIGFSHTPAQLVGLRALQGLSAAFMSPAALSIVLVTFRDGPQRNKALGYWTMVATGGAALGLLLGGVLTEYFGWRWNFFINVPIGIVVTALIGRYVPVHDKEETERKLDAPGALLVTGSLMLQVLAFSQAPQWGWLDGKTLGTLGVAIGLLVAFLVNESRVRRPLMPLRLFRIRNVTGANMIMAPLYASMLGTFFLTTLYIQGVLHYTPVVTGLSFLPFPIVLIAMTSRVPKLVQRYGFQRFLIAGPLMIIASLLWMSHLQVDSSYIAGLLPAFILMPIGVSLTMMPTIAAATSGVPSHQSGVASGLITTSQMMGGALGLAVLSGVAASAAQSVAHLGTAAAAVHGYHEAFLVDVLFMVIAALVAIVVIRQPKRASAKDAEWAAKHVVLES